MEQYLAVWAECWPSLFAGLEVTLIMAVTSLFCAFFLGIVLAVMGLSHIRALRAFYTLYLYVVRGVPVMIFALFLFFGVGALLHVKFNPLFAAIVTLTINASAYLAEIFRGGIQAVDVGQVEAARSLGLSSAKTMLRVVLPQAFKIAIPSLVNQFIITVKDTSILSVIGLAEVVNRAKQYVGSTYSFFATYVYVGALYLVVISLLMVLSRRIEKRMSYDRKG